MPVIRSFGAELEPALLILNVRSHKLFVRLSEIDDPFDDADDARGSAGHNADTELNNSFGGVAENKLVNSKPADEDRTHAGDDLLVGSHRFPVSYRSRIDSLHWLITGVDGCERRLAGGAVLRRLIVNGSAFCAVSSHLSSNFSERLFELRIAENTQANNSERHQEVTTPQYDTESNENDTEKFGLLGCVQS